MVSVRFLRRLECLGAPPLKEARGTPRLIQQTMSAIDEVKRLGSTALPSSPTTAARNVRELTAVSAISAPCCQRYFEKQMSACFSWVLWAVRRPAKRLTHLREQTWIVVEGSHRIARHVAPIVSFWVVRPADVFRPQTSRKSDGSRWPLRVPRVRT